MKLIWEYCEFGFFYYRIWIKKGEYYYSYFGRIKINFWKNKYYKSELPGIINIGDIS